VGGVDSFLSNHDEAAGGAADGHDENNYFDRHSDNHLKVSMEVHRLSEYILCKEITVSYRVGIWYDYSSA